MSEDLARPELHRSPELLEEYNRFVLEELAVREPAHIAAVVTIDYVFDFVILYESIRESWTFFPHRVHAFVVGQEAYEALSSLALPDAEVHLLPGEPGAWLENASQKVRLVEYSDLDRCLVSDVDNVFLAETPELLMLLDDADFVFVGAPHGHQIIQTNLWSYRKSERTIAFSRKWHEESSVRFGDAGGLPFALLASRDEQLKVHVLARPKPRANTHHHLSPYDVQANIPPFSLTRDPLGLGYREPEMGRAKVVHLGALHKKGSRGGLQREAIARHTSLEERLEVVVERFPESSQFLPLYATLATRAARRLGMPTPATPRAALEAQLEAAGALPSRSKLADLLNRQGLVGSGAVIGAGSGFANELLARWHGRDLLSVDVSENADAAGRVSDRSLDFVYLDAGHDYASVRQDLELWFGKVRPGGIVAGSNFVDGDLFEGSFAVRSAVSEFFAARDLEVRTTALDAPWVTWFVALP